MTRRVGQSALVQAVDAEFRPDLEWVRLSFVDLDGDPLEPVYVDGATTVAVWPLDGDLRRVRVMTWSPSPDTIRELARLQADWPPAYSDVRVRSLDLGGVDLEPCETCWARRAYRARTTLAEEVRGALERGAHAIGRTCNARRWP